MHQIWIKWSQTLVIPVIVHVNLINEVICQTGLYQGLLNLLCSFSGKFTIEFVSIKIVILQETRKGPAT